LSKKTDRIKLVAVGYKKNFGAALRGTFLFISGHISRIRYPSGKS
jgi:hypothetical protein